MSDHPYQNHSRKWHTMVRGLPLLREGAVRYLMLPRALHGRPAVLVLKCSGLLEG
jgi:hypothetical protein